MTTDRREFLAQGAILGGVAALAAATAGPLAAQTTRPAAATQWAALIPGAVDENGKYALPKLDYPYDAVSAAIDAETMELHHSKHHLAYVNGLLGAEKAMAEARTSSDHALAQHWARQAAFHGGGHMLHCIFWDCMGGEAMGAPPTGALAEAITRDFGGYEPMWAQFAAVAKSVEGSGWALLCHSLAAGKLVLLQAQNQQLNTQWGVIPLLALDVWEHAYYLRYKNNRGAYVDAFPKVINWSKVAERHALLA